MWKQNNTPMSNQSVKEKNPKGSQKICWNKWKWKYTLKHIKYCISSSEREVYNDTYIYKGKRKISNNLTLTSRN